MATINKFLIFEQLLSEISDNNKMQAILKTSVLEDLRYVFEHASLIEMNKCLEIASNMEQFELCIHLKQLIKEKIYKG